MPTKPLDRLMFVQGGACFFCKQPLPKAEASVEHLLASANGGDNSDENCVACCKAVNALLGSMSLKEKFQVVLNQKGHFTCPNGAGTAKVSQKSKSPSIKKEESERLTLVIANLKQRGTAKPSTLKKLMSSISTLFPKGISDDEVTKMIEKLKSDAMISIDGTKITYSL